MEDRLKELMQELGNAINGSLSDSDRIAAAIAELKRAGYDVFMKLDATIGFNKREDGNESSKAAATAELVSTGTSAPGIGSKIPNLKSGNFAVSFKQAGLNEGTATPLPLPSTSPQPPADAPTPPAVALKREDRLKKLMQELGNAVNGSLSDSDRITAVIAEIKRAGYDVVVTLEATIGFNKRKEAEESSEAAGMAEVVATEASAPGAGGKTPNLASGKATVSFKQAGFNEGTTVQRKVTSPRQNPPTPPPLPSTPPQRPAGPPQPLAGPSAPPAVALKTMATGQKVTITDGTLQVYQARNLSSAVIISLARGQELQLGAAEILEGREWVEAYLEDGGIGYVLGPSVRSHTTLGATSSPRKLVAKAARDMSLRELVGKLNHTTRTALEGAFGLCLARTHYDAEIEHFLLKLLGATASDATRILQEFGIDTSRLQTELERSLDKLKSGNTATPHLSPFLLKLLTESWTLASLDFGASKIRSGHAMLVLLSEPELARLTREVSTELAKIEPEVLKRDWARITGGSEEDREAAATAEVVATGASAPRAGGKTPDVASGKVTVSFEQTGLNEGATAQLKVAAPRQNPPTPPPAPSAPPQRPAGPPPLPAAPSAPPAGALKMEVKSEVLLRAAGPDLFRLNAFRVTGLAVDATPSQITRQVEKLRLAQKFGGTSLRVRGAFALDPPPDADQLRAALQRLHDPEVRLVDEFFWFWPHDLDAANADEALTALAQGSENRAAEIWARMESEQSVSKVSMHNLAVMAQLRVLDLEQALQSGALDAKDATARAEMWRAAFRRWKVLLSNEAFWSRLTARIQALDDPRLTTGTSRRTRESLPLAMLSINAQLALRAAQAVNPAEAKRQLAVLQDSEFDQTVVNEALRSVIEPLRGRIKNMCQASAREVSADTQHGDSITRRLFEHSRPLLATIDCLLPAGDPVRDGAHDEVALQALDGQIAFGQKTEDWRTSVQLLEEALAIAASASARSRIEENLVYVRDANRRYTCFFCDERRTEESAEIDVSMHGNVKRQPAGYNQIQTTWDYATIKVPRCSSCATAHKNQSSARESVTWVAWLSCIFYVVVLCFIGGLVWEGWGAFACIAGGLATWLVPSMMARGAAHVWLEGVKAIDEKYAYPAIQKRKAEGWRLEAKPPGGIVPTVASYTSPRSVLARWAFFRQHVLAGHNVYVYVWSPILLGLILLPSLLGLFSGGPSATRFLAQVGFISARSAVVRLTPELDGDSGLKTFTVLKPLLQAPGVDPGMALQALETALNDKGAKKDERLCVEAAQELGRMGAAARAAIPTLEWSALDPRESVGDAAADALRQVDPERATDWAITNLASPAVPIRRRAVSVLAAVDSVANTAIPALLNATDNSDAGVRTAAMQALAKTAPDIFRQRVLAKLIRQLRVAARGGRESAAEQLGILGSAAKEALPALEKAAQDADPEVRSFANEAAARVRLAR